MKCTTIVSTYVLLYLWMTSAVVAQQYQLQSYTLKDGLPQSQVNAIVQDEYGYLWLGTQGGGLCNFDGSQFVTWNTQDGLASNYIQALSVGKDSIFIGTRQGLSIKTTQGFRNFEAPQINTIHKNNLRTLLGTMRGIYQYSLTKGVYPLQIHSEIDSSSIQDITYDGRNLWVATATALWRISALQKKTIVKRYSTGNFTAVVSYQNKIFAATFNDGIKVINRDTSEELLLREPRRIRSMTLLQNQLWAATDLEGITRIDPHDYSEIQRIDTVQGVRIAPIRNIIMDRQFNIWIATAGSGIYKYFQNHFTSYTTSPKFRNRSIYAIHHASSGLWGSNEEGLFHIDTSGISKIPAISPFSEAKINTITSDPSGAIWAGTDGHGIWLRTETLVDSMVTDSVEVLGVLRRDTITIPKISNHSLDTRLGLPSDWIQTLQTKGNTVWVATQAHGIAVVKYYKDKDSLGIRTIFGKAEGISDIQISDLKKDPQGKMWYATQNGYLGFIDDGMVTDLGQVLQQNVSITSLYFYRQKIFIGTAGSGVWWSDYSGTGRFKKLKGNTPLASENIHQLIVDHQEHLWVGTERGLDQVTLNQNQEIIALLHFDKNDGVLGTETMINAVSKDSQNNVWFGTVDGLIHYQGNERKKSKLPPEIHFEHITVANQPITTLPRFQQTANGYDLSLQPHQNQLSFTYRTIDLNHPNAVQYRFRLNDSEWSPWSYENQHYFVGLAYGPHTFSVQSQNYQWRKSKPIHFRFYIHSPLYQKPWFQWGMLLLIAFLFLGITLRYIKIIKRKNQQKREQLELKNHLLALEHKALQLQMNPHFIFNVLNGIKAMSSSNPQKMNATIHTFALMLRATLHNSRKDYITIAQEIDTLKHYITLEQIMATVAFEYDITLNSDMDSEEVLIPPMLVQPFVENAIRHGIVKATRKGTLQIDFSIQFEKLSCTITDNGIGIFQSQYKKQKTNHQSVALQVTKERLASIAGADALSIQELTDAKGSICGTQISFTIPVLTDY